jgi:hypothetical protein
MLALLSAAGRSFLRAFVAALIVLGVGVLAAPSLSAAYLVGVSALVGAFAAGVRALQAYKPGLSLVTYLGHPYGDWADSFLHAFVATLIVTLPPIANAPDLHTAKALAVAAIVGAFNAGVRALQGLLTTGEHPSPHVGIAEPPMPYSYAHPTGQAGPPQT